MKKHYLLSILSLGLISSSSAQTACDQGRYANNVYSTVDITSDILYGNNTSNTGTNTNLNLDFYEPNGDTSTARPLIIWAHGGSFIFGTKADGDVVELSNRFTKKGFVCASIDYRLGISFPFNQANATKAVLRAVQDMKAAVRFFYKDRLTTDTYKIDTNQIFIAGSSAGALTAYHYAYLDKECELEGFMSSAEVTALGGLEGNSGNPGYSTKVKGAIGLAGALGSYGWIETGDIPFCATHGTNDGTVPYNRGNVQVLGTPIMLLDGSRMMHEQAEAIGLSHKLYSHYGKDHVPHASEPLTMDTTEWFIRDFLIEQLGCSETALQPENAPLQSSILYQLTFCGLGIETMNIEGVKSIYPNPSSDKIFIELTDAAAVNEIQLIDLAGRIQHVNSPTSTISVIEKGNLVSGTYILRISYTDGSFSTNKIAFQ
ncbi:MAG: T9SS type A sorting domain-containing protein [Crocinitomicaceae bacterium]